jgi:hypothetical protein
MVVQQARNSTVITRLDRAIQYAVTARRKPSRLGLLDARFRGHDLQQWGSHV